jgi:hypothetical protein
MKRFATIASLTASLLLATTAFAFDQARTPASNPSPDFVLAVQSCDNGIDASAFFQADDSRYGNNFAFGASSVLSSIEMVHNGYQTVVGPYSFDVELYDDATCTFISSADNLSAANAFSGSITETFNLCSFQLTAAGSVNVTIDANSCFDPTDCYPDVEFDNTVPPTCQRIVTPGPTCVQSSNGGNFLLRVDLNNCPTPASKPSWGAIKVRYN